MVYIIKTMGGNNHENYPNQTWKNGVELIK